jgi:hypothetical protein
MSRMIPSAGSRRRAAGLRVGLLVDVLFDLEGHAHQHPVADSAVVNYALDALDLEAGNAPQGQAGSGDCFADRVLDGGACGGKVD